MKGGKRKGSIEGGREEGEDKRERGEGEDEREGGAMGNGMQIEREGWERGERDGSER